MHKRFLSLAPNNARGAHEKNPKLPFEAVMELPELKVSTFDCFCCVLGTVNKTKLKGIPRRVTSHQQELIQTIKTLSLTHSSFSVSLFKFTLLPCQGNLITLLSTFLRTGFWNWSRENTNTAGGGGGGGGGIFYVKPWSWNATIDCIVILTWGS